MTDDAQRFGQVLVYLFVSGFGLLLAWCIYEALRDAKREWRVEDRIERIGSDQCTGVVERLTAQQVFERRAERRI